jgi:hypothetical protein
MAKIVFSAVVGDARKKIGGTVFTKGRSGAVVRRKVSPIQPRSSLQRNVRASFTALSKLWGGATMDDTKRAGWNALASNYPQKDKFGASHTLTGLQMFQKLNRVLATIGAASILTPPASLSAEFPGAITGTASAPSTLTVSPTTPPTAADTAMVFAGAQVSPGRLAVGNRYRFLQKFVLADTPPWDIHAAYTAKFGALIATKKVPILVKYATTANGAVGIATALLQVVS